MRSNRYIIFTILALALVAQGCATSGQRQPAMVTERPEEYQLFFSTLDNVVEEYKVREASDFPVRGFPYLRTNRFLTAMKDRPTDPSGEQLWVERMQRLDLKARKKEVGNLPDEAIVELKGQLKDIADRKMLLEKISFYSQQSLAYDQRQTGFYDAVKAVVNVEGEYSMAMRTFGLYPIAYIPVAYATEKQYKIFEEWHQKPLDELEIDGSITVFAPPQNGDTSMQDFFHLFSPDRKNALGLPDLSETEMKQLVFAYAPVINQDVTALYDFFGEVRWQNDHVTIDYRKHTLYYYITYSLLKGEPVIQLNYAFWYSGRWGEKTPGIERGPLDGVTVRITFDSGGRPVMLDIMNNCGCYYFSVPRKERVKQVIQSSNKLYPFVPTWLPDDFPQKRLNLRINSGWHQIQHVYTGDVPSNTLTYQLVPYDVLESLPQADGMTESVFSPKGIMKDSSRIEPYIFFSMGIPKVGYMRQRGHHAIKLIGRAHFTDTDLFDNSFVFK